MGVIAPLRSLRVVDPLTQVHLSEQTLWALRCTAEGMPLKEVAIAYGKRYRDGRPVTRQRIDYFLADARQELGARTTAQAIYIATKRGLL